MKYLLILVLSYNSYAVTPLKKGEPAPNDGYHFSKKEEEKLRATIENSNGKIIKLEQLGVIKDDIINEQKKQVEQYSRTNDRLHKQLEKRPTGFWGKVGYFMLGAVITGLVSYGAARSIRR